MNTQGRFTRNLHSTGQLCPQATPLGSRNLGTLFWIPGLHHLLTLTSPPRPLLPTIKAQAALLQQRSHTRHLAAPPHQL